VTFTIKQTSFLTDARLAMTSLGMSSQL